MRNHHVPTTTHMYYLTTLTISKGVDNIHYGSGGRCVDTEVDKMDEMCNDCVVKEWFGCQKCMEPKEVRIPDMAWEWVKEHAHEYGLVAV